MLTAFATRLLTETTDPVVVAVFRLAISETVHAPKVAQALESIARKPTRDALRAIMANAKSAGLLVGDPDAMTEKFLGLLSGELMTGLLLQVADRPSAAEIARRARERRQRSCKFIRSPARTGRETNWRTGIGDPGITRTCDLRFRKPSLYPAELRDRGPAW